MGLTIHYTLHAEGLTIRQARSVLRRIAERASSLNFAVSEIRELPRAGEESDIDGERMVPLSRDEHLFVPLVRGVAIQVDPGGGCESATFGLARHPAKVRHGGKTLETGLTGWSWQAFCKTQYASNPKFGGAANFLRCHLGVIALLDLARELGIVEEVVDEGGYWERRDQRALIEEIGEWNECIAALGGALKDAYQEVEAPIFNYPTFEPLEARGQRFLRRRT